jgi:hypothetical protein
LIGYVVRGRVHWNTDFAIYRVLDDRKRFIRRVAAPAIDEAGNEARVVEGAQALTPRASQQKSPGRRTLRTTASITSREQLRRADQRACAL